MKKVLLSVLAGFMFCLQTAHADVDLYDPKPQFLPDDVAQEVYRTLAKEVPENCNALGHCIIDLKNFQCESIETPLTKPEYSCGYGWDSKFSGANAERVYQALVRAGFISDCDDKDGTCEIDPVRSITCRTANLYGQGQVFGCVIEI